MIRPFTIAAALLLLFVASAPAAVIVPGDSNPYLAGMPDGSEAGAGLMPGQDPTDFAPEQSPIQVPIVLTPGMKLGFSATGQVKIGPLDMWAFHGPDGGPYGPTTFFTTFVPTNGLPSVTAPPVSLVGIFLDDSQPDGSPIPSALDFDLSSPGSNVPDGIDYLSLAPELKQIFFIGDGLTSGGIQQAITVPLGATRLFLAIMDRREWFNNVGQFEVEVFEIPDTAGVPEPSTLLLASLAGIGIVWQIRRKRRRAVS